MTGGYYIASASSNRAAAERVAARIRELGHKVTSTWHAHAYDRAREHVLSESTRREIALRCVHEIRDSHCLVAVGHPDMKGALWECGFAAGCGLPVLWVGSRDVTLFAVLAGSAPMVEEVANG